MRRAGSRCSGRRRLPIPGGSRRCRWSGRRCWCCPRRASARSSRRPFEASLAPVGLGSVAAVRQTADPLAVVAPVPLAHAVRHRRPAGRDVPVPVQARTTPIGCSGRADAAVRSSRTRTVAGPALRRGRRPDGLAVVAGWLSRGTERELAAEPSTCVREEAPSRPTSRLGSGPIRRLAAPLLQRSPDRARRRLVDIGGRALRATAPTHPAYAVGDRRGVPGAVRHLRRHRRAQATRCGRA